MRIIGGEHKGIRLRPPANLPVRPTTDLAKEALFNILQNRMDFQGLSVLDLFAGTGSITFEFASRGAGRVVAVDQHGKCVKFVKETASELGLAGIETVRADVLRFLKGRAEAFDVVFADPPYDLPALPQLPAMVLDGGFLAQDGLLIVEHPRMRKLAEHPAWQDTRNYGNSAFSFYRLGGPGAEEEIGT